MKIAIIHLSDFHIHDNGKFLQDKINGFLSALNILGKVDDYIIVFSGDLSFSGQINEFKKSRYLFGSIIHGIKNNNNNKYVNLYMVPGNHDMCFPNEPRTGKDIQSHYDDGSIEDLIPEEEKYLNNFYSISNANSDRNHNTFINKKFYTYNGYCIQFNLINTAPFSTLSPDDKELHYFPNSEIEKLTRSDNANLCITVMHHSCDWFNWKCKDNLERAIIDNSEFLLYGHDHRDHTASVSIDNNGFDTWISAAGEMDWFSLDKADSFNAIVVNTETETFDGLIFTWDAKSRLFVHRDVAIGKNLQNHTSKLTPLPSYINIIKKDTYNRSDDFTKYFVFPKLAADPNNEFIKGKIISNIDALISLLTEKKRLVITGATNSGKTILLKYIYFSLLGNKMPLFLSADSKPKIRANNFIRHLFEEQYGDDRVLFEKYQQLDLDKKVLIVDGWDLLNISKNQKVVLDKIKESFGYLIISVSSASNNIVDEIKEEISGTSLLYELHIKLFYTEKRNELVERVCSQNENCSDDLINNVNRIIDSIVQNDSGLFTLNPAFIVRYTNCFIQNPYQDYTKGEAVFSKIFEFELTQSIIDCVKTQDVDEFLTVFEEIAGYMYTNRVDELPIGTICDIVETYNKDYGEKISARAVIEVGKKAKIFQETDDCHIFFSNRNHLSYFIAKYLIRLSQGESSDFSGIEHALKRICTGINSDIILFISYILNNTKLLSLISSYANSIFDEWDAVSLSNKNISLFHNISLDQIEPPTDEERERYEIAKEESEESAYSEEIIEARGLFADEEIDINQYFFKLQRAIKYTEVICKALPAFHSTLKLEQKKELTKLIYLYPRKIVYALVKPIDVEIKELCNYIIEYAEEKNIRKNNGEKFNENDILKMLNKFSLATMLATFDYFSELATSPKSFDVLMSQKISDISEEIEKLLIIENSAKTDQLVDKAKSLIETYKGTEFEIMFQIIVREHLMTNKNLTSAKRQQIVDKIFGKENRKIFLIN